jgi:hypothetical protein
MPRAKTPIEQHLGMARKAARAPWGNAWRLLSADQKSGAIAREVLRLIAANWRAEDPENYLAHLAVEGLALAAAIDDPTTEGA